MTYDRGLFNLIAEIIAMLKSFGDDFVPEQLIQDQEESMRQKVLELLAAWEKDLEDSAINGLSSPSYCAIMDWCRSYVDNFYILRILVCELDAKVRLGWEQIVHENWGTGFESLNDNVESTDILILPNVPGPQTTYMHYKNGHDGEGNPNPRKTADEWADNLNSRLNHFFYVRRSELNGYTVHNYIYEPPGEEPLPNELKIGAFPFINKPYQDILSYDDTIRRKDQQGNEFQYLGDIQVKDPEEILNWFRMSYHTACAQGIQILLCPEMLGVEKLYQEDQYQFNPEIRNLSRAVDNDKVPKLIVVPSLWKGNRNYTNVYTASGRKLCTQYKQHRYLFLGRNGKCYEDLQDTPKEICLIHIPGWGRIVILICIDFIYPDYRNLLVSKLKANLLLCPSFSPGKYNFLQSLDAASEYGAYAVWLNACPALTKSPSEVLEVVGAACAPTVSNESRIKRFDLQCAGNCGFGCMFMVTLPLNCMGPSPYEGQHVIVQHIVPSG